MKNYFLLVIIGGLFYVAGQYVATQPISEGEISVTGTAEVTAVPEIAKYSLSVNSGEQISSEIATYVMTERFNRVISALRGLGIEEADIKSTNLGVNPIYDFNEGAREISGYEASQTVEVTIRDTSQTGEVVARAVGEGVNQAGGLRFEVGDLEEVRLQAQEAAIKDARQKAEQMASALGVRLGDVKNFSTSNEQGGPVPVFARAEALGGDGDLAIPEVPVGDEDISATVSVTFEIR